MTHNKQMDQLVFISKPDEWFDAGTEAILLCLTGNGYDAPGACIENNPYAGGLFRGFRNGQVDEEQCCLSEFFLVTKDYLEEANIDSTLLYED